MAKTESVLKSRGLGRTARTDSWWTTPTAIFLGLAAFIVYGGWAGLQNAHYEFGPYTSPFYSPTIFGDSPHAWFGPKPGWWPGWLPFSPCLFILPFPALFRFTCYYFRGAYYKGMFADPPNCAVGEHRKKYLGETRFPFVLQNIHRYFLYIAILLVLHHVYDTAKAFWFSDETIGQGRFGIGVGSLVMLADLVLISMYVFGCHSLRHLVGGKHDCLSEKKVSKACYGCVSSLNNRHMLYAWLSLGAVGFADLYVRLVSMGVWTDFRIL